MVRAMRESKLISEIKNIESEIRKRGTITKAIEVVLLYGDKIVFEGNPEYKEEFKFKGLIISYKIGKYEKGSELITNKRLDIRYTNPKNQHESMRVVAENNVEPRHQKFSPYLEGLFVLQYQYLL